MLSKESALHVAKQLEIQAKINEKLINSLNLVQKELSDVSRIAQNLLKLSNSCTCKTRCTGEDESGEALHNPVG